MTYKRAASRVIALFLDFSRCSKSWMFLKIFERSEKIKIAVHKAVFCKVVMFLPLSFFPKVQVADTSANVPAT